MMLKLSMMVAAAALATACSKSEVVDNEAGPANSAAAANSGTSITRLDCGSIKVGDFSKTFSDRLLYASGPKELTNSCYLVAHDGQHLLWDSGLPAALKGKSQTEGDFTTSLDKTIVEQLAQLGLKPDDVDVVGVSHMHFDHTGQAAQFPAARLVAGKADFEESAAKDDPFGPWRGNGAKVTLATADVDVFGDGTVKAIHLPGHTPDHMALLVNLQSGPVLLSGDLYHAAEAREKRGVPPFNTDRTQTLASMDKFEALAKQTGARVVIQHEPADVPKLPAFPKAAQ